MDQKTAKLQSLPAASDPTAEFEPQQPSTPLEQAKGWGDVAREAYANCEKDDQAEQEVHRRRNRSGQ